MVIEATRTMVSRRMSQLDPSHDMLHVERVRRLALEVADPAADRDVIELAALCHDLNDAKYSGMVDGAIDIEAFLSNHDYPKANLVATIVQHIGYRKEIKWNDATDDPVNVTWRNTCLELHAVQDADKLDAMGAFGIMRCMAFSGARQRPLYDPDQADTAVGHYYDKLMHLSKMMRTERGKVLAKKRDSFMKDFVEHVRQEYDLVM
ncbi:hypothetical protein BCR43DRAFT_309449 [Syncephalastrum racemosum]|uniref:HD/PDEase domain-containing protein n=1 Tax=Syncephalastrum racemosum TaxID=13706 RepID=A0A1X2HAL6_SYNRA|nr:hypothetical protein BCR43DRAFT_309449 [Syncephalastrum racemosum]